MQNETKATIDIIQGDSFMQEIEIEGADIDLIEGVYFSCEKLNLCKKLKLVDGIFVLEIESNETINFPKVYTTFDLTIRFTDNKIKTVVFCYPFNVHEKKNKVGCIV